ncbi:MAG: hypothetical protein ACFFCI_07930 [Promethearchaeota archaeon]
MPVLVIAGILFFILIFFPLYGITLRYQIGSIFRTIFSFVGKICLFLGIMLAIISLAGAFVHQISWKLFLSAVILLWIGCWLTGAMVNLMGLRIGDTNRGSGGYY